MPPADPTQPAQPGPRPNVVVFAVDQMGAASLACNGNPDVETPNLDALADAGHSFQRAYCNNPVCMPSRATLITGRTPRQHGCISNGMVLDEQTTTMPGVLAESGYRTHAVGKLHHQPFGLPADVDAHSWESRAAWDSGEITGLPAGYYGYQTTDFVGGHGRGVFGDYANWLDREHPGVRELYSPERAYAATGLGYRLEVPAGLHYNDWIASRACDFLSTVEDDEPFFLSCSFPDPHLPFAATRPYSERYDPASITLSPTWNDPADPVRWLARRRTEVAHFTQFDQAELREIVAQTYGMISHIDDCIGRVLHTLRQGGKYDNTIIVFLSDHGEYLGAHHLLSKSVWPYEDLLRVPFIWRTPHGTARGPDPAITSHLDLVPTILDYTGVGCDAFNNREGARSDWPGLPGRSLRPHLEGTETLPDQPALVEFDEDWTPGTMTRMRTVVSRRHKLVQYAGYTEGILFDLESDPNETTNLWNDHDYAQVRSDLTTELVDQLAWSDPLPGPRISGA
ncbi:protein of unknown function [Ruania alba]|uniref:Sulfatase N-terminal domain-containing protein n=2 Tax=Ruania alba TaxID=648782 RepID=A0A1H5MHR5_9MICO|nr:protein of unknown function [Ruania alba]